MKKSSLFLILSVITGVVSLISCDKEEAATPATGKEVMVNASDYTKWVYFSFEKGEVMGTSDIPGNGGLSDPAWVSRTDWDIAFHRADVRTNSGKSGNGQGGIQEIVQETFDFAIIKEAPATGYVSDDELTVTYDNSTMGAGYVSECKNGGSTVAVGWAKRSGMPPVWNVYKKVFALKTGNGKYAKVYLKNFLNNEDKTGYVTMEYVYQPDGSTNLNTATE